MKFQKGNTYGFKKGNKIGNRFQKGNNINTGRKQTEEHKRKVREQISGENHYLWIEDRTQIKGYKNERNNPEYKQWRYQVYKRDRYECKMKNSDCKGKMKAHHICPWKVFPELRYIINNGITLCHFHHPKKRVDEQRLIPVFQTLVEVK